MEATHVDKSLLLLFSHFIQAVVMTREVSLQASQGLDRDPFDFTSLRAAAGRGKAEATDTAACAYTGGQDVLFIKHA